MDFKWTVTTQAPDPSIPVDSSNETLHSICEMGNAANWVHCKWDRENWNHREQLYEISDSSAAMARAQLCQACIWKEATGGWREIRG